MTIQLIHGDCLDVDWPQVDAIITDVPYGTTACKWDVIIPFDKMWEKIKSSLKPRGAFVTTASQPFTSALVMSNPNMFRDEWIWDKVNGSNFGNIKKHPFKTHENILVFSEKTIETYNPIYREVSKRFGKESFCNSDVTANITKTRKQGVGYPSSIITNMRPNNLTGGGLHPTQKPVALYEYLIKTYTNEGDTVLDFCAGSGTTLQACINTGRNGIGIEKDEKYYNIAKERLGL